MSPFLPYDVLYRIIHYFCVLHLPTACEILDHDFHSHPSVQQLLQFCFISKAFYHAAMPHIFKHVPLNLHEFDHWPQCLQFWSSNETEDLRVKVRRLKIAVKSHGISKYCFVEKNTPHDQALALSAAKERQLRTLMVGLINQLELPMAGLPSLRELIFSVDTFTNVYSDDFVVNRTIPDLVLRTVRDLGCALSNGRFDHLTSLRVKAPADQLVEILLGATRSKQLCVNLKSLHYDRFMAIGSVEDQDAVMAAEEAVLALVELCPNLKELCLFTFHEKPQLHPENTGLDKLIVGRIVVKRWKPLAFLEDLVAPHTSVELDDVTFARRRHIRDPPLSLAPSWPQYKLLRPDYELVQKELKCRSLQVIKGGTLVFPGPTAL
ncbi:hypothetical protein GE21DRAFT_2866 [Neurospora crassa]|uniref:F-box domain-containing protein n=1 Tax=Neurospora crassa (strain ATCC 24698 / 74-OR23-1A / CBS 708.71 / DSM 1257 / FGSC 987) TaxID=367110 RepID=Q7RY14_NEUCR|nr:hypothetical protein NCU03392 [Neurospora crassa OR74A]EAA27603.3 hypothetical protein NCU03392 [Neurospora crassa OR74A]KHE86421.1 hypothetical protein GE21DRAFT_2866 [Neurospora crassa]|eukprot:XP_956839.3 hypothetical protein NCU03392 [Neurospora crassa OR74A]